MSLSPVFQTSACTSCPFHNCISFPWLIYWSDAIKYQLTTAVIIFELQNISYPHLPVVVKIQLYDVLEWELKLFHSTFFLLQLFIFYHINKLWQKNTILRKRHLHYRAELVLLHAKPGDDHLGQQEREMMIAMNFSEDLWWWFQGDLPEMQETSLATLIAESFRTKSVESFLWETWTAQIFMVVMGGNSVV